MKHNILFSALLILTMVMFFSCGDPNDQFDMRSPQVIISTDSLEVTRGSSVELKALLTDESGLLSCKLEYTAWEVNEEIGFAEYNYPQSYEFTTEISVPEDAILSWEEDYQKNDGTIFRITQTWHKLSMTLYDTAKNRNIVHFYIKVNP